MQLLSSALCLGVSDTQGQLHETFESNLKSTLCFTAERVGNNREDSWFIQVNLRNLYSGAPEGCLKLE